jgi:S-adenosyl methyltransferase
VLAIFTAIVEVPRAQRGFLDRAISYLAGQAGLRQFLDAGSGLPHGGRTHQIVTRLMAALAPGSYLVLAEGADISEAGNEAQRQYNQRSPLPYHLRSPDRIAAFFTGLDLVEPGVGAVLAVAQPGRPGAGRSGRRGVARKP